jgi:hypothetical protein
MLFAAVRESDPERTLARLGYSIDPEAVLKALLPAPALLK